MPETEDHVRPRVRTRTDVSDAIAAAWARVILKTGRREFADRLGVDGKTVGRAMSGETVPELHTVFNSLLIDPTALNEVAALYGFEVRPMQVDGVNDMAMIGNLTQLATDWIKVMEDGVRDHRETLELAKAITPLLPKLQALVAEAERHRRRGTPIGAVA